MTTLRITLWVIGGFQLVLGAAFLLSPSGTAELLGLQPPAPASASWLIAMMAARFLGYGVGMIVAARNPAAHRLWIDTMIGIQTIDWTATMIYLLRGDLTLSQVSTAAVMPIVFVAVLVWGRLVPMRSGAVRSGAVRSGAVRSVTASGSAS